MCCWAGSATAATPGDGNETNSSDDHADNDDRRSDDRDSDDRRSDDRDSDDADDDNPLDDLIDQPADDGAKNRGELGQSTVDNDTDDASDDADDDTSPGPASASANADGIDDWDLPASAFRPDPPRSGRALIGPTPAPRRATPGPAHRPARWTVRTVDPVTGCWQARPFEC